MVELLIGKKGTGKTKALIEKVNNAMSQKFEITFVISVSIDAETAPDYIKKLA